MNTTTDLLSFLETITAVEVSAYDSGNPEIFLYHGVGSVLSVRESVDQVRFEENGTATIAGSTTETTFHNALLWRALSESAFSLSHLRHETPVELGVLKHTGRSWEIVEPHYCGSDTYVSRITRENGALSVVWRISGGKKNQEICFRYRSAEQIAE